jgi:hypothetical protein
MLTTRSQTAQTRRSNVDRSHGLFDENSLFQSYSSDRCAKHAPQFLIKNKNTKKYKKSKKRLKSMTK